MSVLQQLSASGIPTKGLPTLLVWSCRMPDELEFLGPRVLAMAQALGLQLTIKLFCTGEGGERGGRAWPAC
jgi:hypothetical protein